MGYNEQALALYEAKMVMMDQRFDWLLSKFYAFAKAEGWGADETDKEYQTFEKDPEDYFKEW